MSNTPSAGTGEFLLDSSILVRSLRGDKVVRDRIAAASRLYIPSPALGELYYGAFGSPTRPADALADVDALASTMTIMGTDASTALIYGRIGHDLKLRGLTMPDNDLWIAATAIQYDLTLAARDAHFNWVSGLRAEQW